MDSYHALAKSYDRLTWDVDYDQIVGFYQQILDGEGLHPRTAVDLACGTGSVALRLAEKGLAVTAVDQSEEMLCMAQQKAQEAGASVQFVCQSLQKLHLPRAVDLAVCALDSLDYITSPADCKLAIKRIYKALNPFGCFIFDVNTPEKLRAMDGEIFLDEDEDVFCLWRGSFNSQTNICTYGMDLFQRQGDLWQRSREEHEEYAYSARELTAYLQEAGFTDISVFGDRKMRFPEPGEQRIFIKARKGKRK